MADYHMEVLTKHCRVCAKLLARFKVSYRCADRRDDLEKTFGVVFSNDSPDVQPTSFCHSCYNVLVRARKAREANRLYTPCVQPFNWSAHTNLSCDVCDHFEKAAAGGRPKKQKIGWPPTTCRRSAIAHLHTIAPPSYFHTADYRSQMIQPPSSSVSIDDLVCPLCSSIVDRPIHLTTCNKLVCMNCQCKKLEEGEFCCPCCTQDRIQNYNTMVQPSPVVMKILGDLQVSCGRCQQRIAAGTANF